MRSRSKEWISNKADGSTMACCRGTEERGNGGRNCRVALIYVILLDLGKRSQDTYFNREMPKTLIPLALYKSNRAVGLLHFSFFLWVVSWFPLIVDWSNFPMSHHSLNILTNIGCLALNTSNALFHILLFGF